MASPRERFSEFLSETEFSSRVDELFELFTKSIDMHATIALHSDIFKEKNDYMQEHFSKWTISLPSSSLLWVPCALLEYICRDLTFKKRLQRFCQGLSQSHYRELSDDDVEALGKGAIGNTFLSWDMTLCLILNEADDPPPTDILQHPAGGLLPPKPTSPPQALDLGEEGILALAMIQEMSEKEAAVAAAAEGGSDKAGPSSEGTSAGTGLELVPFEQVTHPEGDEGVESEESADPQELVGGDVGDAIFQFLGEVIVDGIPYIFLHDLEKVFGLTEAEALSVLCTAETSIPLDTESADPLTDQLQVQSGVETNVALTLQKFKESAHKNVSEEEFTEVQETLVAQRQYPTPAGPSSPPPVGEEHHYTYDISAPEVVAADDKENETLDLDIFAGRQGGKRERTVGRDASLAHYIGRIPNGVVLVIHSSYSPGGQEGLIVCKALSKFLCTSTVTFNADKIILVRKSSVMFAFGSKLRGQLLSAIGIAAAIGEKDTKEIVESATTGDIVAAKRRRKMAKEKIKRLM